MYRGSHKILELGSILFILLVAVFSVSIVILNYFSVLPISLMYPSLLSFLPDQKHLDFEASPKDLSNYFNLARKANFSDETFVNQNLYTIDGVYSGYETNFIQIVTVNGKENFALSPGASFSEIKLQPDSNDPTKDVFSETVPGLFSAQDSLKFGDSVRVTYSRYKNSKIIVSILRV